MTFSGGDITPPSLSSTPLMLPPAAPVISSNSDSLSKKEKFVGFSMLIGIIISAILIIVGVYLVTRVTGNMCDRYWGCIPALKTKDYWLSTIPIFLGAGLGIATVFGGVKLL